MIDGISQRNIRMRIQAIGQPSRENRLLLHDPSVGDVRTSGFDWHEKRRGTLMKNDGSKQHKHEEMTRSKTRMRRPSRDKC